MIAYFYAIEWAYGPATDWDNGHPIGDIIRFTSEVKRDAWIDAGNPRSNDPGARSAMSADLPYIQWIGAELDMLDAPCDDAAVDLLATSQ